jgi:predicted nucleic acid-binding protein
VPLLHRTPQEAWAQLEAWFPAPTLRLLGESPWCTTLRSGIVQRPRVRGAVVHDARIAALCLAHGVKALLTRDRDFSRFPELPLENPFA